MAITRIQYKRGTSTGSSISLTLTSTPTYHNLLVAVIGTYNGYTYADVNSISQGGVTWTKQVEQTWAYYPACVNGEIWVGVVTSLSASKNITVNLSAGGGTVGKVADICEYSGLAISGYLDKTASNFGSGGTDTGTTATTTQNNELWVGGVCWAGANGTQSTPQNGFTLIDGALYNYNSTAFLEKIVSSIGAATSGTTRSSSTGGWVGVIATLKASITPSGNQVSSSIAPLMRVEGMLATKVPRKLPNFSLKIPELNPKIF